ncbi:hypothetical protein [Amycolatopsis alkalitolerans]|uniref:Uncharacterized protein n=1 Tax=Amycolatopsis alkalitolerans TaxID=2547244 RepID=A0A5C4LP86_9PSEU|nr:hypothetical protein [Amycolatopsis alkalitolerans]TNC19076.1 hypothetical protein FG385_32950 [Amycolatopsis alkalitolerans]
MVVLASTYDPPEWRTADGELHLVVERQIWGDEIAVRTVEPCDRMIRVSGADMRRPDAPPCHFCARAAREHYPTVAIASSSGSDRG